MTQTKTQAHRAVPYVLAAATTVSVMSTDVFTPSIPFLPDAFDTDIRMAQSTVSINLMAYALAHLAHGPLSDWLGRRALFLWAFGCFVGVTIFCALAQTIEWLLIGRFLQGLCSSVPSVIVALIANELFDKEGKLDCMAKHGMATGLAPIAGPILGGFLHVQFGWAAGFWFVAGFALLTILLFARYVPETLHSPRPLRLGTAAGDYLRLLSVQSYVRVLLPLSLVFGAYFAFVTTAPVIVIDLLGVSPQRYGIVLAPMILSFILGNRVSQILGGHGWTGHRLLGLGFRLGVLGALAFAVPILLGHLSVLALVLASIPVGLTLGITLAAGPLVLLSTVRDLPQGPANALLGAGQLGAGALASAMSAFFYAGNGLSLALVFLVFLTLASVIGLSGHAENKDQPL